MWWLAASNALQHVCSSYNSEGPPAESCNMWALDFENVPTHTRDMHTEIWKAFRSRVCVPGLPQVTHRGTHTAAFSSFTLAFLCTTEQWKEKIKAPLGEHARTATLFISQFLFFPFTHSHGTKAETKAAFQKCLQLKSSWRRVLILEIAA